VIKMELTINTVISSVINGKVVYERILWIDEGNIICYLINMDEKLKNFPIKRKISEIRRGIIAETVTVVEDPNKNLVHPADIKSKDLKMRDEAWEKVKGMVTLEPEIFDDKIRGELLREVQSKFGGSHNTINKYLRRYWKRGKTPNALLPDSHKYGGKGTKKKLGDKKIGRPRKIKISDKEGINVTEEIKTIFRVAYREFYDDTSKPTLEWVYNQMLKKYFSEPYYIDRIQQVHLHDRDELPTIRQFRYFVNNEMDRKRTIIAREGLKEFNLKYRPRTGTSLQEVRGPGDRFQIDATIGNIYLVSRYNNEWIIGRPVIYFISDVFSRMIVGMYVGLEGPSWTGMMMAIANAAMDKVEFCKRYDINIKKEDWDCQNVPAILLGDGGELKGKKPEGLTALGIDVEIAAAFRADWKGVVERDFGVFHEKVKPFLPGYVDVDHNERGGKDYRHNAKLTLHGLTRILIKYILFHNAQAVSGYPRSEEMVRDEVPPIPNEMWRWGKANASGYLKEFSERKIMLNLFPANETATVTRDGISFHNMLYSCDRAKEEGWFLKAKAAKGTWKEKVSYDPRNMNVIYIRKDGDFIPCKIYPHQERYLDKEFDEIMYLHEKEKYDEAVREYEQREREINFGMTLEHFINEELDENGVKSSPISNKKKIENIKIFHKLEKKKNRETEAVILDAAIEYEQETQSYLEEEKREDNGSFFEDDENDELALIREMRKERFR
jgi:hypothetical protein